MAHLIEKTDTMVSAGGVKPWHYFETADRTKVVDGTIPMHEVVKLAGLDWTVAKGELLVKMTGEDGTEQIIPYPDMYATYRVDTLAPLGIVSDAYQLIQNRAVVEFLEALVDGGTEYETAGSLRGNRTVWFLMRMPNHIEIAGSASERIDLYILGATGHDGTRSFEVRTTGVRVVCNNTLSMAEGALGSVVRLQHQGDTTVRIQEAREALQLGFKYGEGIKTLGDALVQETVTGDQVESFLKDLIVVREPKGPVKPWYESDKATALRKREMIRNVWSETPDLGPIRDTRWGVLQAVSAYECHHMKLASSASRTREERRFEITMGLDGAASLTARAAKLLTPAKLERRVAAAMAS